MNHSTQTYPEQDNHSLSSLQDILKDTSNLIGDDYFRSLILHLTNMLNVRFVFVSKLINSSPQQLQTLAISRDGQLIDNFSYKTPGTPCAEVIRKGCSYYPKFIQEHFPEDRWLKEENIESYLAFPLYNSRREPIGHLGFAHSKPLPEKSPFELTLNIISSRAGAELEREIVEEERQSINNDLDTILFNMPAGVAVLEGPKFRYSKINQTLANINGLSVKDHIGRPIEEVIPEAAKNIVPRLRKVWKCSWINLG